MDCNRTDCIHYKVCEEWKSLGNDNYINESNGNCDCYSSVLYGRPKGEWLFKHNSSDIWCSVCDENFDEIPQAFNFCPNCGADMRNAESEDK